MVSPVGQCILPWQILFFGGAEGKEVGLEGFILGGREGMAEKRFTCVLNADGQYAKENL